MLLCLFVYVFVCLLMALSSSCALTLTSLCRCVLFQAQEAATVDAARVLTGQPIQKVGGVGVKRDGGVLFGWILIRFSFANDVAAFCRFVLWSWLGGEFLGSERARHTRLPFLTHSRTLYLCRNLWSMEVSTFPRARSFVTWDR